MFSRELYNVLHIIGIILLMSSLGGVALHAMNGGTNANNRSVRFIKTLHALGAGLILLGGFGVLAHLGFKAGEGFPPWLLVKLSIWIVLTAAPFLPYRRPALARWLMLGLPVLGGIAAVMGIYKPE
jgi:uncharacterized membrane protein SirB2